MFGAQGGGEGGRNLHGALEGVIVARDVSHDGTLIRLIRVQKIWKEFR